MWKGGFSGLLMFKQARYSSLPVTIFAFAGENGLL